MTLAQNKSVEIYLQQHKWVMKANVEISFGSAAIRSFDV